MGRRLWSSPRFCVMQDAYANALACMNSIHRHCYDAQPLRHCGFFLCVTVFPCNRGQLFRLEGLCVLRRAEKPFLCFYVLYVHTTERFYCAVGLKVETQNLASHKQGYAFIVCDVLFAGVAMGWTGDARFCVSTGWRHCYKCGKWHDVASWQGKVETQNLASHKQGYAFVACDVLFAGVAMCRTGDARFCVSTGWRHYFFE